MNSWLLVVLKLNQAMFHIAGVAIAEKILFLVCIKDERSRVWNEIGPNLKK